MKNGSCTKALLVLLMGVALAVGPAGGAYSKSCEDPVSPEEASRVKAPKKKRGPAPLAPWEIKRWGPIAVEAVISCKGRIVGISIATNIPDKLEKKLKSNLSRWAFRPAELDGEAVAVRFSLTLQDGPPGGP